MTMAIVGGGLSSATAATASAFRAYWERAGVVVAAMHANDWDASDEIRASIGTMREP